ncbi:MAG TPA: AAA family ATPase [Gemmatimonadaceae bacterium]|nr:AAA family ATPase [Gemmatimonadaceae bacterium]
MSSSIPQSNTFDPNDDGDTGTEFPANASTEPTTDADADANVAPMPDAPPHDPTLDAADPPPPSTPPRLVRDDDPTDVLELRLHNDVGDHYVEDLELPILPATDIRVRMSDALDHIAVTRKGAFVMGPKGVGKSLALEQAVSAFHRAEARKEAKNAGYAQRSILLLPTLSDRSYRDALLLLCTKVIGITFRQRASGAPKKDDTLLEELLRACLDQRVVGFAFSEAERMSKESLRLMRDIMADGEYYDRGRITAHGTVRAGGVGVLVVGTQTLRPLIDNSGEAGHRWTLIIQLELMPASLAPDIYRKWFPGFETHIARVGEERWNSFIGQHVTHGRPVSLGFLQEHARLYFRRANRTEHENGRPPVTREMVRFSTGLFTYTITELDVLRRRKEG